MLAIKNKYDFRFFYKLFSLVLILSNFILSIAFIFIDCFNNGYAIAFTKNHPILTHDVLDSLISYFFYFTIQSNFLILIWFIFVIFFPKQEGKQKYFFISPIVTLFLTIYIFDTMSVFLTVLLPSDYLRLSAVGWVKTMIFHVISPLLFIIYVLCFYKFEHYNIESTWLIDTKLFCKRKLWKVYIFPIFYLLINAVRSIIRLDYYSFFPHNKTILINNPYWIKYESAFIYPFLNWNKTLFNIPGLYYALVVFLIFFISTFILLLFYKIFQIKQKKYNMSLNNSNVNINDIQ